MPTVFMPRTLEELLALKQTRPGLFVFAGGTDLMIRMRNQLIQPDALACLDQLETIREIEETENEIAIGAGATHSQILANPGIQHHFPVLIKAIETLGSPHIRNMGTLGGNIVTASPAGDCLPPLTILKAQVELAGKEGFYRMPIGDFITGPGTTLLSQDQILWRVLIPKTPSFRIHHFEKVGLRRSLSIAVVSLAAIMNTGNSGQVKELRMAWGSVGKTVITCPEAENLLCSGMLNHESLGMAAELVRHTVCPISDIRATSDYRQRVAGNLLFRLPQVLNDWKEREGSCTRI